MDNVKNLIKTMICEIVDDSGSVNISVEETEKGVLFEVKVGKDDVGKIIGKKGRVASALRTVAKAAGAKQGIRVMVNVFNKPLE